MTANAAPVGLYVHIPFCSVKCFYCDFTAFAGQRRTAGRYILALEAEERVVVGVNRFQSGDEPIELLQVDEAAGRRQAEKLAALKKRREQGRVAKSLDALKRAAEGTGNTMPFILDAVRCYATLGEICDAFRAVFGAYQEKTHL